MSLNWNWNEKVGEVVTEYKYPDGSKKSFVSDLYMGNAYLIIIDEDKENSTYTLNSFFNDKVHMNRCLGIDKKWPSTYGSNMYNRDYAKWTEVRISKEYKHLKDFTAAIVQAFDSITIKVY